MKNIVAATILALALGAAAQDARKKMAETPIKQAMAPDAPKSEVETPVKKTMAPAPKADDVAPGKVKWHASFDQAVEAASKSGKPVLLFQLLGKLTEEWC
jgi:hypothetical protein